MAYLIDTSILVRLTNVSDAQFAKADRAIAKLEQNGETLHLTAQNLIEFRNVATQIFLHDFVTCHVDPVKLCLRPRFNRNL